jgi:hypothetical protein
MKKIRCYFAIIALLATLGGFSLQGMGSMANAASSQHAGPSFAAGQSARSVASRHIFPICPVPGANDC